MTQKEEARRLKPGNLGYALDKHPQHSTIQQPGAIQRAIILRYLQAGNRLTTLAAREELGICHPAARVQSLREAGWNIVTHWATETDITGRKHRIAEYVLMNG